MLFVPTAEAVSDKRVLKLIRAFLNAGVMEDGLVRPVDEGTPQGGPLSPMLSNLVLDDLDKELARRGHRFCCRLRPSRAKVLDYLDGMARERGHGSRQARASARRWVRGAARRLARAAE